MPSVAEDAGSQHDQQKKRVVGYKAEEPEIPGDYDSQTGSVPALPAGSVRKPVDAFTDYSDRTVFWITLIGAAALFLVLTRVAKTRVAKTRVAKTR